MGWRAKSWSAGRSPTPPPLRRVGTGRTFLSFDRRVSPSPSPNPPCSPLYVSRLLLRLHLEHARQRVARLVHHGVYDLRAFTVQDRRDDALDQHRDKSPRTLISANHPTCTKGAILWSLSCTLPRMIGGGRGTPTIGGRGLRFDREMCPICAKSHNGTGSRYLAP